MMTLERAVKEANSYIVENEGEEAEVLMGKLKSEVAEFKILAKLVADGNFNQAKVIKMAKELISEISGYED